LGRGRLAATNVDPVGLLPTRTRARSCGSSSWNPWGSPRTRSPALSACRRGGSTSRSTAASAVTADIALPLTRCFGLSEGFFLGLQVDHDLLAQRRRLGDELTAIEPRAARGAVPQFRLRGNGV
jgi:hypothetical protein